MNTEISNNAQGIHSVWPPLRGHKACKEARKQDRRQENVTHAEPARMDVGTVPVQREPRLSPYFLFPVSRAWTSWGSRLTCLLGFASFSCSPSPSSDSFSGTGSCTTRNPVRLLVSVSTPFVDPVCAAVTLFVPGEGLSHADHWGHVGHVPSASWYTVCFQGLQIHDLCLFRFFFLD